MSYIIQLTIKEGFKYFARIVLFENECGYNLFWEGLIQNSSKWKEKVEVEEWVKLIIEIKDLNLRIINNKHEY